MEPMESPMEAAVEEQMELPLIPQKSFCCVCLNTFCYNYINLPCCHQDIHKKCMIDWILSPQNKRLNCPTCREPLNMSFSKAVTLGEIIDEINTTKNGIPRSKFNQITETLYPDSPFNFNTNDFIDETDTDTDTNTNSNLQMRAKLILNLLFAMFMLLLFSGYFFTFANIKV